MVSRCVWGAGQGGEDLERPAIETAFDLKSIVPTKRELQMREITHYAQVCLLIRHPNMEPQKISDALDLEPQHSWKRGTPRMSPKGNRLEGFYKWTSWSHSWEHLGDRLFFHFTQGILDGLVPNQAFFNRLSQEGGSSLFAISLFGQQNIGDNTSLEFQKTLTDMKIQLGVEVFPDWNEAEEALGY